MRKNFIMLSLAALVLIVLAMSAVSAYKLMCLTRGESIPSAQNPVYTCHHDSCQVCVDSQKFPTAPTRCKAGCELDNNGGTGETDTTPPVLTVNKPTNGELFNSRKALVDLSVSEGSDLFYIDAINGRGRWSKICTNCVTYSKNISFSDGQNIIQFKAVDHAGNEAVSDNVSFFTDSRKPRIRKTLPRNKDFGNGDFEVDFQEANPSTLILFYGNNGSSSMNVDISSCTKNPRSNDRYSCDVNADLSSYNGQLINYWFTLIDIVGNNVTSKPTNINVDLTQPVINNPDSFFSHEDGARNVNFNISVTEDNFDKVEYSYTDSKGKLRERTLCSKLKEGMCVRKVPFASGEWHLTVSAWDEAGNSVALPADFTVN
ncbi:hypothetical protein HY212_06835 [Candidatus Pacearchaeota archaeon]|nr:hypothetical protein [Candidatus Pacearchaeota archaeon]